ELLVPLFWPPPPPPIVFLVKIVVVAWHVWAHREEIGHKSPVSSSQLTSLLLLEYPSQHIEFAAVDG
ncbi:hypothetical protein A2U01_0048304, partial [Trifolium medium]|nr:hypothetical protein [Trifolium medium]